MFFLDCYNLSDAVDDQTDIPFINFGNDNLGVQIVGFGIQTQHGTQINDWNYFTRNSLGNQLIRAADSIAANLSEGYGRFYYKENKQFCYYSRGSLCELKTWLIKAHTRALIKGSDFEELIDEYLGYSASQIYVHSVTIIAGGDVFSGETYTNVDDIGADFRNLAFFEEPVYTRKSDKDELRNMMFLSLVFGLFGTFIVSTLYSYLITRFRRREVAVLKAMGYSKWDVRIVVLSEILVVAITGFAVGLALIQSYLFLTRTGSYVYWIINPFIGTTAIFSFLAVVISCVPGFFLITARILGIRPIEIFRQK